jgi:hypothetical protein
MWGTPCFIPDGPRPLADPFALPDLPRLLSGVQWRAVVYGYTFVERKAREFWQWLRWKALTSRIYFARLQPTVRTTRRILSGFCAEAAVLIAVFPYLDFLIAQREPSSLPPIDMGPVKRYSAILSVMCLVSAVILAIKTDEQE